VITGFRRSRVAETRQQSREGALWMAWGPFARHTWAPTGPGRRSRRLSRPQQRPQRSLQPRSYSPGKCTGNRDVMTGSEHIIYWSNKVKDLNRKTRVYCTKMERIPPQNNRETPYARAGLRPSRSAPIGLPAK
jgi:hypothetical protein